MAKRSKPSGFFVVFEGGEGTGKSTQVKRLVYWLKEHGLSSLVTFEPGGTEISDEVRELLLNPRFGNMTPNAELFLYLAARAQHAEERIRPALETGTIVICDRYTDSTQVYQGLCRKLGQAWTAKLNRFATQGLTPDLTIVLDVPVSIGLSRIRGRASLDRMEQQKRKFHEQVRKGFRAIAKKNPSRYALIDGTKTEDAVAEKIAAVVQPRLKRRGLWTS